MGKTKFFNKNAVERHWVLIDAKGRTLGRLATRIAMILMGKSKPQYTPNAIVGDAVVVINARHISVSGNKRKEKTYDKYSGYHSGRKEILLETLMKKNPTRAIYYAVKGMVPKNALGKLMMRNLKIYADETHPHQVQDPQKIEV